MLGVLGHGGVGITYRALDRQLGREVARDDRRVAESTVSAVDWISHSPPVQDLLRKGEEQRRNVEDEARSRAGASASAAPMSASTPGPAPAAGPFDGTYVGFFSPSGPVALRASSALSISLRVTGSSGSGTMTSVSCGATPLSVRVPPSGSITGDAQGVDASCARFPLVIQGRASNGHLSMTAGGLWAAALPI